MNREQFDAWLEEHYDELLAVAKRHVRQDAPDVLQTAVAGMLASAALPSIVRQCSPQTPGMAVWPWAVGLIRSAVAHSRRTAVRKAALRDEAKKLSSAGTFQKGRKG